MSEVSFGIAFIAGLLSFLSPCVLPLVPAYIGYMGSRMTHSLALQTAGQKRSESGTLVIQRVNMLAHSVAFVLGFTLVFVSIGLATTALFSVMGSAASLVTDIISRLGGIIIILFGLHFMGALRWFFGQIRRYPLLTATPLTALIVGLVLSLLLRWGTIEWLVALPFIAAVWLWLVLGGAFQQPHQFWMATLGSLETRLYSDTRREMTPASSAGLGGSFLMGVVFSAGWTPCIGPIYGTILTVAANTGDVGMAMPLLIAYSLGLGVPFIAAGLLLGRVQKVLKRLQRSMHRVELVTGALLVFIGVLVATGQMTRLTQSLNGSFADISIRIEECGVGVFQERLALSQVGACMNGTLHPLVLRQSATVRLNAEETQAFVFNASADQRIDIQISPVDDDFTPRIVLLDSGGSIIAENSALTPMSDGTITALAGVPLPSAGLYTVEVSNAVGEFRFKAVIAAADSSTLPAAPVTSLPAQLAEIASQPTTEPVNGNGVGSIAPDFTVTQRDGTTLRLADLRGSVVILNFWGTWCLPCQREMPDLQALYAQYGDMNFTVLALAVRDTPEAVDKFVSDYGITFRVALDEDMSITRQYRVNGQPTTLVIGTDGHILQAFYSVTSPEILTPLIEDALS